MSNFLKNKAKFIFIIYAIFIVLVFVLGLFYMTQYANVHMYYDITDKGLIEYNIDSSFKQGITNENLFNYFARATVLPAGLTSVATSAFGETYGVIIYNFQTSMSSFNSLIVIFAVVSLISLAIMIIASNQSRKIYYKSNLITGVLCPGVNAGLMVALLINNLILMGDFNSNINLYKVTAAIQDTSTFDDRVINEGTGAALTKPEILLNASQDVNSTTFIVASVIFGVVAAVSICMCLYAVYRYKESAKRRKEIIERAVQEND